MIKFANELKNHTSDESWNIIDTNIKKNIKQIIYNEALLKKVFGDNNKKISFDYYENEINAYIKKVDENLYEINISKELILLLLNYSYIVFEKYDFFHEIDNDSKIRERARSSLFYFWIEIIFLHEVAHFFRNHLDIENIQRLNEFYISAKENKMKSNRFYYEIDADRYAGKLYAGVFHLSFKNLQANIPFEEKKLIEKYIVDSVLYLFDFLYLIDKSEKEVEYITYPHPKQRIVFFLTGITEAKHQNNDTFKISLNELEKIVDKKHIEFVSKFYINEDFSMYLEHDKLFDAYNKFLEKKGLA